MFMNRQEKGQLDKKRIEEIVNYLLENFSTTIVGKYSSVNGINLDLNDEDDDYIVDIRQDIDELNEVLKGINKKTTDNLKSKISKFRTWVLFLMDRPAFQAKVSLRSNSGNLPIVVSRFQSGKTLNLSQIHTHRDIA